MTNIDPSKTSMPASASIQLPGVPPVSGRPPGSEKEPLLPPSVEPGEPFFQRLKSREYKEGCFQAPPKFLIKYMYTCSLTNKSLFSKGLLQSDTRRQNSGVLCRDTFL